MVEPPSGAPCGASEDFFTEHQVEHQHFALDLDALRRSGVGFEVEDRGIIWPGHDACCLCAFEDNTLTIAFLFRSNNVLEGLEPVQPRLFVVAVDVQGIQIEAAACHGNFKRLMLAATAPILLGPC